MQTTKNLPYYITATALFILLKFSFTQASNHDLIFLLKPTDALVVLLTGSHSAYAPDKGYYFEALNILIDKSCSGFNFWVLSFLLFTYLSLKYCDKPLHKLLTMPLALIAAYALTLFVNTSRIFTTIIVQAQTNIIFPHHQHIIHETIGIITNLTFLILTYILIEKLLTNKLPDAKFT